MPSDETSKISVQSCAAMIVRLFLLKNVTRFTGSLNDKLFTFRKLLEKNVPVRKAFYNCNKSMISCLNWISKRT